MDVFSKKLNDHVAKMGLNQLVLFSVLNCKKILPSYQIFSRVEMWGDTSFFDRLIENAAAYIVKPKNNQIFLTFENNLIEHCPNLDDFDSNIASYAFDACCAFDELLKYLINVDKKHVIANSEWCLNTVDMFIQQKENITYVKDINELNRLIEQDDFMINEKNRQLTLLNEIQHFDVISEDTVELLDNLNNSFGDIIDYKIFT